MAFYSDAVLKNMGFHSLGENVRISDKASIHNAESIDIGSNSRVDDFCVLSGKIEIGCNVHIAVFCNLAGGELGIQMCDFSGLAYGCHIFSQSDDYSGATLTNPTVPDQFKNEKKARIIIGRHVIIGTQSVVFPGVNLAEGCAIGAMSLVRKSTEPWGIYQGNPAKRISERRKEILKLEAQLLQLRENDF